MSNVGNRDLIGPSLALLLLAVPQADAGAVAVLVENSTTADSIAHLITSRIARRGSLAS
jgi:hypothetical protein